MTREQVIAAADQMALAQFKEMGGNYWGRFWVDGVFWAGVAESTPFSRWVDTDDLNDGINVHKQEVKNDLHSVGQGFKTSGTRYAAAAIELIEERKRKPALATESKPQNQ